MNLAHLFISAAAIIMAQNSHDGIPFIRTQFAAIRVAPGEALTQPAWEEKVYRKRNLWEAVTIDGTPCLHCLSDKSASMLYKEMKYDANTYPLIQWKWKVLRLPEKGREHTRATDDYGARVYIFFPGWTFLTSYVLEYVWDNESPAGTIITSPSSGKCKLIVVNSGTADLGKWITIERNVRDDYAKAFGAPPDRNAGAIGFMSDADNTSSRAEAYYGPLIIGR